MTTIPPKKNYLNNKDILKEIHLSKNSYCSYTEPSNSDYDFIIDYLDNNDLQRSLKYTSDSEVIQRAREGRASRLTQLEIAQGTRERGDKIDPDTIKIEDIVFRVMTWDHIPLSPKVARKSAKPKTAKEIFDFDAEDIDNDSIFDDLTDPKLEKEMGLDDMVHVRLNFPPFQHFKIDSNGSFYCVGKSHWIGDLTTGEFSKDHGQLTNKMALIYLKLCEKYSLRFNWRGYTYVDEMRGAAILQLTYVGLRFNEAKSQNPFAYYTATITNSFCRVLNSEKRVQNIRDDILEMNDLNPSYTRQHQYDLENARKRNAT
jgi:hypothetical protein